MRVRLSGPVESDLETGYWYYEAQAAGVGDYFLASLRADLLSLGIFGGIHSSPFLGVYRALAKRFPYAIYYVVEGDVVTVLAVLDGRRNPEAIRNALRRRGADSA